MVKLPSATPAVNNHLQQRRPLAAARRLAPRRRHDIMGLQVRRLYDVLRQAADELEALEGDLVVEDAAWGGGWVQVGEG